VTECEHGYALDRTCVACNRTPTRVSQTTPRFFNGILPEPGPAPLDETVQNHRSASHLVSRACDLLGTYSVPGHMRCRPEVRQSMAAYSRQVRAVAFCLAAEAICLATGRLMTGATPPTDDECALVLGACLRAFDSEWSGQC